MNFSGQVITYLLKIVMIMRSRFEHAGNVIFVINLKIRIEMLSKNTAEIAFEVLQYVLNELLCVVGIKVEERSCVMSARTDFFLSVH